MLMHSGCHEEMILDFETNNSYLESSYCMNPELQTVCWVIIDLWTRLQCLIYGRVRVAHCQAPTATHTESPHVTSYKCCLAFHQHNGYHKLLTF